MFKFSTLDDCPFQARNPRYPRLSEIAEDKDKEHFAITIGGGKLALEVVPDGLDWYQVKLTKHVRETPKAYAIWQKEVDPITQSTMIKNVATGRYLETRHKPQCTQY